MEWAPSLSLAQESKQQGNDWSCRRRTSVDASRPPLLVLPYSCRGRFAHCHTLTPTHAHQLNPGQMTVAGDTCWNHQSPAVPCSPIWFVLMCRERSLQARQRRARLAGGHTGHAGDCCCIWRDINHTGRRRFGQGCGFRKGERVAASAGDGFLASPACPPAKLQTAGGSGEEPHPVLCRRLVFWLR